ncbi:MAG TPA: glycine C-acetyltransferase, partial [Vicinamibacteria bacterium]|nr:glycine C-acetyltransferase [Vicinamibacteria bacterium]
MFKQAREHYRSTLKEIQEAGLEKSERIVRSPQGARITVATGEVLNFCANNYLGLSSAPEILEAAHQGLDARGFGLSSVRFICGTQDIHKELEGKISRFLGTEDTILYGSCFDANGGLFETLLSEEDAVVSDALNHASIIDGIRLSKAKRFRYQNRDLEDLERQLKDAESCRIKLIATDGVFSMDGTYAPLDGICELAERYQAMVMVDDSHATGFVGEKGRGTPELFSVQDRVDIVTSTMGKALGGAAGGFTSSRSEIVDLLRQRSRPYLFSNSLAPSIVSAANRVFDLLETTSEHRLRLLENTAYFRKEMTSRGFQIVEGTHPIVPVMLGDARLAQNIAKDM